MEDLSVLHSQTRKNLVTPKSIRLAAPQSGFEPGSPGEMTDDLRLFIKEKALTVIISEYSTLHLHCHTLLTYLAGMRMKTNGMKYSAYGLRALSYVHVDILKT